MHADQVERNDQALADAALQHARELISRTENDWMANPEPEDLAANRWAIIIERDEDSWVVGVDTIEEAAGVFLGCYTNTEGYDEWVEGVYDVTTGEHVAHAQKLTLSLDIAGESAQSED